MVVKWRLNDGNLWHWLSNFLGLVAVKMDRKPEWTQQYMMPVNVPLNRPYDKLVFKDPGRKRIDQTAKHGDPAPKKHRGFTKGFTGWSRWACGADVNVSKARWQVPCAHCIVVQLPNYDVFKNHSDNETFICAHRHPPKKESPPNKERPVRIEPAKIMV